MKQVFLSWYDGFLDEDCELLRTLLNQRGFTVVTSPHSPHCGLARDTRWGEWYRHGLPETVARSNIFVACITDNYESTWMAQEFDVAANGFRAAMSPRLYTYNPHNIKLPKGFQAYLTLAETLPLNPQDAVEALGGTD